MPDPVRTQLVERAPHVVSVAEFTRMNGDTESRGASGAEAAFERPHLGGPYLVTCQVHSDEVAGQPISDNAFTQVGKFRGAVPIQQQYQPHGGICQARYHAIGPDE